MRNENRSAARHAALLWAVWVACGALAPVGGAPAAGKPIPEDRFAGGGGEDFAAATRFVESSDRYLHHDRLRRGMTGYGLTVLAGTEIVRFGVEIVSVMPQWGPHQDVILAKLSEQNLEKTGIIGGMSGSPCFVKDPRDGKDKMIGAVAYGWSSQKEPLCGIQPITQMLAMGTVLPRVTGQAKDVARPVAQGPPGQVPAGQASPAFLAAVLDPHKRDFSRLGWPEQPAEPVAASSAPRLLPLTTPLMVSGLSAGGLGDVGKRLEPVGIVPLQAGGVTFAEAQAAQAVRLEPGGAIAVTLVAGDASMSAVGTVTEVVGDQVLAFGHSFFADGDTSFPLGPAYIHTVISSLMRSNKLGAALGITGELTRDEQVGVGGIVGREVRMIPMTVSVRWENDKRTQTFSYRLCWHRRLTPALLQTLLNDAVAGWRTLPELYLLKYDVRMDFGKLGEYRAANISSNADTYEVASDLVRPVAAMLNNPWSEPPRPERIDVSITVESRRITADILELRMDGQVYRPGETATGQVVIRPFRGERALLPVRLDLPADLPDGKYLLEVGNHVYATGRLQAEMPHRFRPESTEELFRSVQSVVEPQADHLYVRLSLPEGGLALDRRELPNLPDSKAGILADARRADSNRFIRSVVNSSQTPYVPSGSAAASFQVEARPNETMLREQRN